MEHAAEHAEEIEAGGGEEIAALHIAVATGVADAGTAKEPGRARATTIHPAAARKLEAGATMREEEDAAGAATSTNPPCLTNRSKRWAMGAATEAAIRSDFRRGRVRESCAGMCPHDFLGALFSYICSDARFSYIC